MAREAITTTRAPRPVASYSQACRVGDLVAVAGQVGTDPVTEEVVSDAVGPQTHQALRNVRSVLQEAGCDLEDVLRVDCYLADWGHVAEFNEAYATWFSAPPPARTTVVVGLPAGLEVEITVLAVAPRAATGEAGSPAPA